jgi:hypothetical protein
MKNLKISVLSAFLLSLFLFSSCGKKVQVVKTVEGSDITFTVPAQPAGDFSYSHSAKFDIEAKLKDYNVTMDDVKNVKLESMELIIEDPMTPAVTWDIVDNMKVDLESSTIPKIQVAAIDNVPHNGASSISPTTADNTELVNFARGNDITYWFSGTTNKPLDHDITVRAKVKYKVTAEVPVN